MVSRNYKEMLQESWDLTVQDNIESMDATLKKFYRGKQSSTKASLK